MSTEHPEHDDSTTLGTVENSLGEVRLCDCGGVHLAMGPLTLHFDYDDLDDLVDLVCAGRHLAERGPDAAHTPADADSDAQPHLSAGQPQAAAAAGETGKAQDPAAPDETKKVEKKKRRMLRSKAQSLLH
jgi:hypothetical protein